MRPPSPARPPPDPTTPEVTLARRRYAVAWSAAAAARSAPVPGWTFRIAVPRSISAWRLGRPGPIPTPAAAALG